MVEVVVGIGLTAAGWGCGDACARPFSVPLLALAVGTVILTFALMGNALATVVGAALGFLFCISQRAYYG